MQGDAHCEKSPGCLGEGNSQKTVCILCNVFGRTLVVVADPHFPQLVHAYACPAVLPGHKNKQINKQTKALVVFYGSHS